MEHFMEILNWLANMVFGHADVTIAFAVGVATFGTVSEGVLANTQRWHGSIDDKMNSINNLVDVFNKHPNWMPSMLQDLLNGQYELQVLVAKCRTNSATTTDRMNRDVLSKDVVDLCLSKIRMWAYGQFADGKVTAADIHDMGFLVPGEAAGHHDRAEATDVTAQVKVRVINEDIIRVVIDQSAGENAAEVVHGWPNGVRNALIVITAADGITEVFRLFTTRLHNDIQMPEGSRGKQFMIKASFLVHVNDIPRFGAQPTFSMPLTTEDLAAALERQHKEDIEAHLQEEARLRHEIEQLQNSKA
jgi:hypothetical protein